MSAPDRILAVYDGTTYLGEIRDQALSYSAHTADGQDLGSFTKIVDAAIAISKAPPREAAPKRRAAS